MKSYIIYSSCKVSFKRCVFQIYLCCVTLSFLVRDLYSDICSMRHFIAICPKLVTENTQLSSVYSLHLTSILTQCALLNNLESWMTSFISAVVRDNASFFFISLFNLHQEQLEWNVTGKGWCTASFWK